MYHIHITIDPPTEDQNYVAICEELGLKPLVITNIMWGDADYVEYIPTASNYQGTADSAILHAGIFAGRLSEAGFKIRRCKVEGRPEDVPFPRYFETHIKITNDQVSLLEGHPISHSTSGGHMLTIRRMTAKDVFLSAAELLRWPPADPPKIEACLFDNNPALDDKWINQ